MSRLHHVFLLLVVVAAAFSVGLPAAQQINALSTGTAPLRGVVTATDGKPLEGVTVSARGVGSTITTSVWTDQKGEYYFPLLPNGPYRIWAQAVGFEFNRVEQTLSEGKAVHQNFKLAGYREIWRQLDDAEWIDSLPDGTPEDKGINGRMKRVIHYNCSNSCHNAGYVLAKRFTAQDWDLLINHMSSITGRGDPPADGTGITYRSRPTEYEDDIPGGGKFSPLTDGQGRRLGAQRRIMEFYRKDIVSYLSRVRGPEPFPITFKTLPRPTGEAANIVVTEYDVPEGPRPGALATSFARLDPKTGRAWVYILNGDGTTTRREPEYYLNEYHNGSNWTRGSRASGSMMETRGQHDVIVGNDGYVYFTPGIGVGLDPAGNVWFTGGNGAVKFDVAAEKFVQYPLPKGWDGFHNGKAIDSKGIFWGATEAGAYRLDPQTKEWKLFPSVTPLGRPYGLTVDAQDNAWFAQIAVDKIGYVNGRTGEVGEVVLAPIDDEPMTPEDRKVNRGWTWNQPLYGKGPRRLRADRNPNGRYVWVAEYFGGRLARIDIHTKAVKEYKLPGAYRYSMPYEPVVDKNGIVWLALANSDYQAKFDPSTEQFTFYPLPTRAHNARNIDVDNKPAVPEVWVPYEAGGKVARIQFRTHPGRVSGSKDQ